MVTWVTDESGRKRKITIDLRGMRFGKLVVEEYAGHTPGGSCLWRCRCNCGGARTTTTGLLRQGRRTGCGCSTGRPVEHGHCAADFDSPLYRRWQRVRGKEKCCARWRRSTFVEWHRDVVGAIGERPPGAWLVRVCTKRVWSRKNVQWLQPEEALARPRPHGAAGGRISGRFRWCTDGTKNVRVLGDDVPTGWRRGCRRCRKRGAAR